jgi:hypothetical protein
MARLTRQGARNLTAALDNLAQVIQHRHDLLGLDARTATDFAYRCDLLSDAIERTASQNFPLAKNAAEKGNDDEGMSVEHGEGGFDPNLIGDEVPGPLEVVPPVEGFMEDHFTQEKYHVLGELQESGELGPVHLASLLSKAASILLERTAKKGQQKAEEQDGEEQQAEAQQAKKGKKSQQKPEAMKAKKGQQKAEEQDGEDEEQDGEEQQAKKGKKASSVNDWGFNLTR